jgi:hypothetical protein
MPGQLDEERRSLQGIEGQEAATAWGLGVRGRTEAAEQLRRQRRARGTLVSLVARATRTGMRAERASDSFFLSGNGSAGTCRVACTVI